MGDNLQDKPRKELKELCSQNNIRTAGVKHEDLVRLLRNKLYPSAPQTPRSTKTRAPKEQSPVKDNADSYKTPVKTGGKGWNLRTLPLENQSPQEVTSFRRKNSGLSRKPLLTKSNTFSSGRTDLCSKAPGVNQDAQANASLHQNSVRRLCQVNGLSPLSRRSAEAPGQLVTTSEDGPMAQTDSNAKTEEMTSPRAMEGDANGSAVEPSDAGSDVSRRVSEIATDAGPDTMSDFSDADEFRSVSSEPISRFSSLGKGASLRTESSKMSLLSAQSGLSFFTAGSWGSDNSKSMDNLLASVEGNDAGRGDVTEDIFPEFPEGSDFLVGDTDALELSFLDAGAADPEVIVNGKDHGVKADQFNAMDSPMARDYVNYNRGSETDVSENCVGSSRVSIAELTSDQDRNLGDVNMGDCDATETSVNAADKQRESPAAPPLEDAESEDLGRINGEFLSKNALASGTVAIESKQSCSGDIAKEDLIAAAGVTDEPRVGVGEFESRANRISLGHDDDLTPNNALKDGSQPNEFKSAGNPSEIALDMEHLDVEGWGVDTPTQSRSCSYEDGTSSISNGVRYSEGHSSHAEPTPEDSEDEAEVHSKLLEGEAISGSGSPMFDSRDYSVAKKLEFEPVEITQLAPLPQTEHNVEDKEVDNDAATPSASHQQKSELVDKTISSRDIDSFEAEDRATSTPESTESHSNTDMCSVTPISVNHSDSSFTSSSGDNTAPKLDQSGCPAEEQEGYNVKLRDEECASPFGPVHDNNEDGREKEDIQAKLSFPLSIILWCSQSCSPISGNHSQSLTS